MAAQQEEMDEDTLSTNDLFYPDEPMLPATSTNKKRSHQAYVEDDDEEQYMYVIILLS